MSPLWTLPVSLGSGPDFSLQCQPHIFSFFLTLCSLSEEHLACLFEHLRWNMAAELTVFLLAIPVFVNDSALLSRCRWTSSLPQAPGKPRPGPPSPALAPARPPQQSVSHHANCPVYFSYLLLLSNVRTVSQQVFRISPECGYLVSHAHAPDLAGVSPVLRRRPRGLGLALEEVHGQWSVALDLWPALLLPPLPAGPAAPGWACGYPYQKPFL